MKHILKYKIFEELSEEELNYILDKIDKKGMSSLTSEEKRKLDSFGGEFDKQKSTDDVSFDKDGNLLINGKPPYKNVQDDSKSIPKNPTPSVTPPIKVTSLYTLLQNKFTKKEIIVIKSDTDFSVSLDKNVVSLNRTYYIHFKRIKDKESRASCLKMDYNLNSRSNDNFKIYDNYLNKIEFRLLPVFLSQHGLTYKDFNDAFYYTENDFNEKSY